MLGYFLKESRESVLLKLKDEIKESKRGGFLNLVNKRLELPLAYITGDKEFFGLEFKVCQGVLIPRPESEVLVEEVLKFASSKTKIHDAFTGSGAIAISVKKNSAESEVSASDISNIALQIARENAKKILGFELDIVKSDILLAFADKGEIFDLITANPPYLIQEEAILTADKFKEPLLALDGGVGGLELIKKLVEQAKHLLKRGGRLLLEADPAQDKEIENIFSEYEYRDFTFIKDLIGLKRVFCGRK